MAETVKKINFTEKYPDLFEVEEWVASFVTVPKLNYIVASWESQRDTEWTADVFKETWTFLGWLAFSLKFRLKGQEDNGFQDYEMPPMEAIRDTKSTGESRTWKVLLMQPPQVTAQMVRKMSEIAKMKQQDKLLPTASLESFAEGPCVQTLHVGPYDQISTTIDFLEKEAKAKWFRLQKGVHEIYLNDRRRTKPDNLQTIVRCQLLEE